MKKISLFFLLLCVMINAQSPLSKFTASISGANTIAFSNSSTGSPTSFTWEFTGGTPATSTSSNPVVSYPTAGIYTAKLTVTNSSGSSVSKRSVKVSNGNIIDLSSGKNNDGTLKSDADVPDTNWKYTDPNGNVSTPITRVTATAAGWTSASTNGISGISRWITGNNMISGDHYYASKEFEVPAGITTAKLNLRTLSFVRNWTYLVKKNSDGSETETPITATTFMSDGAKGWLNSRSPEVINYSIAPGKYFVKIKVFTNNTGQRQAVDVNAYVNLGSTIDLSSGKNDDGTLKSDASIPDTNWTYIDPSNIVSTPITRVTATAAGWVSASTGGVSDASRWITGDNFINGYHYYIGKEFEIPQGNTVAVLNLRSLSFVRNWTYLVKKNSDGSETETQITATTFLSDGAKGWLNSRSPEVINYPIAPGKYFIRVKVFTNNSGQRQSIDVNANVNLGNTINVSPMADFSATPTMTTTGANVQFANLSDGVPLSFAWNFEDGGNVLTSTQNSPSTVFSVAGNHNVDLNLDYGNNLNSSLKVENYIYTDQSNDGSILSASENYTGRDKNKIITVYPNPVVTTLYINAKDTKDYYYQIYNTSGQIVQKGKFENKQTNVSSLVSGVYFVKVNNAETVVKIIKK